MLSVDITSLTRHMLSHRLTPQELAHKAGVGTRLISSLLNNTDGRRCHYATIYRLAQALNVEPTSLANFGKDGE